MGEVVAKHSSGGISTEDCGREIGCDWHRHVVGMRVAPVGEVMSLRGLSNPSIVDSWTGGR